MLTISFSQVKNSHEPLIHLEQEVEMRPEFLQRSQKLLYEVKSASLIGDLFYNEPYVTGDFHLKTEIVVPSSRSLAPVNLQQDFHFSENYTEDELPKEKLDESDIPIVKVEDDLIDLQTAIEDNLLLHIPITILTPEEQENDVYPHGEGWSVISESEYDEQKKNQVNPAFAKLKILLDENDKDDDKSQKNNAKK